MRIDKKEMILHIIEHFPGIRYKELMKISKLSYGSLSYHLRVLEKGGLVNVRRVNRVTRFFPVRIRDIELVVLELCRNRTRRHIINYLSDHESATVEELMRAIGISRSTISWHIRSLLSHNLLDVSINGRRRVYRLKYRDKIVSILQRYSTCFIDK